MSCDGISRIESLLTEKNKDTIQREIKNLEDRMGMVAYFRRNSGSQILALEYEWEMDCINRRLEQLYYRLNNEFKKKK